MLENDAHFAAATTAALMALLAQSFVSPVFNNPASPMMLSLLAVPWMIRIAERNQCYLSLHDKPTDHFASPASGSKDGFLHHVIRSKFKFGR